MRVRARATHEDMKSLAGRLQGDSFTRNVFLLFSGTAIGQAIPILLSPILTRLYMPDDFGALGVFSSICLTLVPLVTLRYELALLLVANEREAAELIVITAISILIVSFATFLVCLVLPLYPIPALGPWQFGSFILPLAVLAIGAYQLLVYEGTRQANYDPIARTKLLQGLTGRFRRSFSGCSASAAPGSSTASSSGSSAARPISSAASCCRTGNEPCGHHARLARPLALQVQEIPALLELVGRLQRRRIAIRRSDPRRGALRARHRRLHLPRRPHRGAAASARHDLDAAGLFRRDLQARRRDGPA